MTKHNLPLVAILVVIPLLLALLFVQGDEIPLMAKLFMGEFGLILSIAGVYAGVVSFLEKGFSRTTTLAALLCAVLAVRFLSLTIALWPL